MTALNIKDPEVHQMASLLANQWGTTRTGAVRRALSQAVSDAGLDNLDGQRAHIEALLDEIAPYLIPGTNAETADRDLYDDEGLPR